MSQPIERVLTPLSDDQYKALPLITSLQYLEQFTSESINQKFTNVLMAGVYCGFDYRLGLNNTIVIGSDGDNTAVVKKGNLSFTVHGQKPVTLAVPSGQKLVAVIDVFYVYGVATKQVNSSSDVDAVTISLIPESDVTDEHVKLLTVNRPNGKSLDHAHVDTRCKFNARYVPFSQANSTFVHQANAATDQDINRKADLVKHVNLSQLFLGIDNALQEISSDNLKGEHSQLVTVRAGKAIDARITSEAKKCNEYADMLIAKIMGGVPPEELDQIKELASQLQKDGNAINAINASLATKASKAQHAELSKRVDDLNKSDIDLDQVPNFSSTGNVEEASTSKNLTSAGGNKIWRKVLEVLGVANNNTKKINEVNTRVVAATAKGTDLDKKKFDKSGGILSGDVHVKKAANVSGEVKISEADAVHGGGMQYEGDANTFRLFTWTTGKWQHFLTVARGSTAVKFAGELYAKESKKVYHDDHHPQADNAGKLEGKNLADVKTHVLKGKSADSGKLGNKTLAQVKTYVLEGKSNDSAKLENKTLAQVKEYVLNGKVVDAFKFAGKTLDEVKAYILDGRSADSAKLEGKSLAQVVTYTLMGKAANASKLDGKTLAQVKAHVLTGKSADANLLDGVNSSGFGRAYSGSYSTGAGSWTTAQFVAWLKSKGAFSTAYWVMRGSWAYASNRNITDTACGTIHLSGCVIEVIGTATNYTIRVTTPSTSTGGGITNATFIYAFNGSGYAPSWRRDYNTKRKPTKADVQLDKVPNYSASDVYSSTGTNLATRKALFSAYDALNKGKLAVGAKAKSAETADKLGGASPSTGATANTIAKRNGSGDLEVRLVKSNYKEQTTAPADTAAVCFRTNNSSDNYMRFMSKAAIKAWLGFKDTHRAISSSVTSSSTTVGASSKAAKTAHDRANSAYTKAAAALPKSGGEITNSLTIKKDLVVKGKATVTGDVSGLSDVRVKENFQEIDNPMGKIMAINGLIYDRKDIEITQAGLIAQELLEVFPVAVDVGETEADMMHVKYNQVIALLVEGVKDLQGQVNELKAQSGNGGS